MPGFVHLHVHSSYSLLEGALTIARLCELATADRQPALALTDADNMFGALEFSDKMAAAGIQPIVGCALAVDFADQDALPRAGSPAQLARPRIVLLAARENGYRSLMRLNSRAFLETAPNEPPHLRLAWLEGETEGLIALTGGPGGPLNAAIVAGNAPLFARQEDYEAHDALICIAEGRLVVETDRRQFTPEHRFKTRAEMTALFADLPEAVASTVEIARRCAFRPRVQAPI